MGEVQVAKRRRFDYDEIRRRYEAGQSYAEIITALGCSPATVSVIVKGRGLQRGPRPDSDARRAQTQKIIDLYQAGYSYSAIAAVTGAAPSQIAARLKRAGVPRRPVGGVRDRERCDMIRCLQQAGFTDAAIGRLLHVTRERIAQLGTRRYEKLQAYLEEGKGAEL